MENVSTFLCLKKMKQLPKKNDTMGPLDSFLHLNKTSLKKIGKLKTLGYFLFFPAAYLVD